MRIISGSARGRRLIAPPAKDSSIRPTADRAREALFSILGPKIMNSVVLDLFAGTGALGLEAFSRGAKRVVLVDKGHTSLNILKKNLSIFPDEHLHNYDIIVIKDDLSRPSFVKKLPDSVPPQFDIIFADPPYGKNFSLPILEYISKKNILNEGAIIVIEERQDIILPDQLSHLTRIDRRTYGETGFSFYQPLIKNDNMDDDSTIPSGTNFTGVD